MSKKNGKTRKDKIQSQKRIESCQTAETIEEKERHAKQAAEEEHAKALEMAGEALPVKILRVVLSIWVFLILVGVPLYVHDAYNDIATSKWNFYAVSTFGCLGYPFRILAPGCLFIALLVLLAYMVWCRAYGVFGDVFSLKKLRFTDYCVIAFMLFATLSAIFAQDKTVVIWGFPGWYMGLMAQLSFGALYFFISRFYRKRWCLIFAISCAMCSLAVVGIIALVNRFGYDILGLYKATWGDSKWNPYYISTLSHGSWDSVWFVLMTAVAVYLFWGCDRLPVRIAGLFLTAIGAAGCLATDAASAFLGLMVLIVVVFLCSFSSYKRLLRFAETVLTMLISWQVLRIISEHMPEEHKLSMHSEKMILYLIEGGKMKAITLIFALITVIGWIVAASVRHKNMKSGDRSLRIIGIIVYILFATGIILGVIYLILNTKKQLPERLLSDNSYLVLDINWGSGRARMWNVILRAFGEKIVKSPSFLFFGLGPDSLYQVFSDLTPELEADWQVAAKIIGANDRTLLENAHNEWLTMIVNLGILGGIAHLMTFITSAVRFAKYEKKDPLLVMCLSAVVAYVAATFITYQHTLGAPFVWLLMSIGAGAVMKMEEE